jgi:hypothetical protein
MRNHTLRLGMIAVDIKERGLRYIFAFKHFRSQDQAMSKELW